MSMPAAISSAVRTIPTASRLRVGDQRPGGGHGVGAARADADDPVRGLDHVAVAADQQRILRVRDGQQGFQPPQGPVRAPFLGQFGGRPRHVRRIVLQFGFETLQQGEGIGRTAGKTAQDAAIGQPADLDRVGLDHGGAQASLGRRRPSRLGPDGERSRSWWHEGPWEFP